MATHRSLNKLEFKAHMSIHNLVDVKEGETHESNFTRDRFGKDHRLSEEDGSSRIRRVKRRLKVLAAAAVLGPLFCGPAWAGEVSPGRNTNVTVESSGLDDSWLDEKLNPPQEKYGIALDESTSVSVNEYGDPNVGMKF